PPRPGGPPWGRFWADAVKAQINMNAVIPMDKFDFPRLKLNPKRDPNALWGCLSVFKKSISIF
ncbi:MAG TPA: hypothetical protein DCX10_00960, partial [Verrucomicrobiales bacterium]|nr:hypothetical protein [Verrucomicrobiales bacterium]